MNIKRGYGSVATYGPLGYYVRASINQGRSPHMTAKQFRTQRRRLKLSQSQLARALKVGTNTVARWKQGRRAIPALAEVALEYVKLTRGKQAA